MLICDTCKKTFTQMEAELPMWAQNDTNDQCPKCEGRLAEALECKKCGEQYHPEDEHICPIEDAPTDPNQEAYDRIAENKSIHPGFRQIFSKEERDV